MASRISLISIPSLEMDSECSASTMKQGIALVVAAGAREEIGSPQLIRCDRDTLHQKQFVTAANGDAVRDGCLQADSEFTDEGCCVGRGIGTLPDRASQDGSLFSIVSVEAYFC